MRIENDKIMDSIIMLCVFKGLCCLIVKLIVQLSPLDNLQTMYHQSKNKSSEINSENPTSAPHYHKELLFLSPVHSYIV